MNSHDQVIPPETAFTGFVSSIGFPVLSDFQGLLLEQPLMIEEVETAIRSLPPSKTPGLDSLPSELYQTYSETLAPKFLATF